MAPILTKVGFDVLHHPRRIMRLWNWKSAVLSIILRAPIFLAASIRRGFAVAATALLTEAAFCAVSSGFYGACVQALRNAEPQWLAGLLITILIPAAFQALEYLMQRAQGTPHLRIAEIASVILSILSALFNWYVMRRGALLVAGEGSSFGSDMKRMPQLLGDFLVREPLRFLRGSRSCSPRPALLETIQTSGEEGD